MRRSTPEAVLKRAPFLVAVAFGAGLTAAGCGDDPDPGAGSAAGKGGSGGHVQSESGAGEAGVPSARGGRAGEGGASGENGGATSHRAGTSGEGGGAGSPENGSSGGADAGAGGASDELGCSELVERCAPLDLGPGPQRDCGEIGHDGNEAACAAAADGCRAACGASAQIAFSIDFSAVVGAEPFDCGSVYTNVGADDASIRPVDFKFYVHDVRLLDEDGAATPVALDQDGLWQYESVALLDFEDHTGLCVNGTTPTNTQIRGTVPAGKYRGIAFRLGVPFELNHTDLTAVPSPLNLSSLYWSWNMGRLFLSIMTSAEIGPQTRFESALHVGSTGCTGDAELGDVADCEKPNRAEYSFPEFRPGKDLAIADLKGALRQARLESDLCHSFTEDTCRGPFEDLGIDWDTGLPLADTQRFIRVQARPGSDGPEPETYAWSLPKGFPLPVVPAENPMSDAKVELGRHLFYDARLSENGTQSCASCHRQERAFTDGATVATGSTGEAHPRNSMSLTNVAYETTLTWANPLLFTLEAQALVPMFGTEPVELGLNGRENELLARLRAVPRYVELFDTAYPGVADPFSVGNLTSALACFERTLLSGSSPYDRYLYRGDENALSPAARRGRVLFFSEKLECFHCHSGFNLQDSANFAGNQFPEARFHNTGLYNMDGLGAYPAPNTGVHELTGRPEDMGRFRTPTLRNVAVTAPYMHDGSLATLEDVLDHYAAGGRTIPDGPYAGNGSESPLKSPFMIGFTLTPEDREAVLAFLESLTDEAFLTNPRFSDPWPTD